VPASQREMELRQVRLPAHGKVMVTGAVLLGAVATDAVTRIRRRKAERA
jgi:ABC-type xylose transport system permease subunit